MKKLCFFDENVRRAFDDDSAKFESFNKLMMDYAADSLDASISKKEANEKITGKFLAAIGCDKDSSRREIRKAIRRNQSLVFDLIEDIVQNLLVTGWQADPFFMNYVEVKNLALGDKN